MLDFSVYLGDAVCELDSSEMSQLPASTGSRHRPVSFYRFYNYIEQTLLLQGLVIEHCTHATLHAGSLYVGMATLASREDHLHPVLVWTHSHNARHRSALYSGVGLGESDLFCLFRSTRIRTRQTPRYDERIGDELGTGIATLLGALPMQRRGLMYLQQQPLDDPSDIDHFIVELFEQQLLSHYRIGAMLDAWRDQRRYHIAFPCATLWHILIATLESYKPSVQGDVLHSLLTRTPRLTAYLFAKQLDMSLSHEQ